MIVQCAECESRYQLDGSRVPQKVIRVRCAGCGYVFAIDGREADSAAAGGSTGSHNEIRLESGPAPAVEVAEAPDPGMDLEIERSTVPPMAPPQAAPAVAEAAPQATAVKGEVAGVYNEIDLDAQPQQEQPEVELDPAQKKEHDKARRLARALVSDILVYNRDQRDKALAKGNLVQALGPEIKKSWEVYKERVGAEIANSTNHFREALNEILSEGQPIF